MPHQPEENLKESKKILKLRINAKRGIDFKLWDKGSAVLK